MIKAAIATTGMLKRNSGKILSLHNFSLICAKEFVAAVMRGFWGGGAGDPGPPEIFKIFVNFDLLASVIIGIKI